MSKKANQTKVPSYHTGRIILFPILLYFLLVFPVLGFMLIKSFPELKERSGIYLGIDTAYQQGQTLPEGLQLPTTAEELNPSTNLPLLAADSLLAETDSLLKSFRNIAADTLNTLQHSDKPYKKVSSSKLFSKSLSGLFNIVILLSPLLVMLVNYPFKRYFRRKRKRKTISPRLYRYCRRWLLHTPLINSGIVFIAFLIVHGLMIYSLLAPDTSGDELGHRLFTSYLFISIVASLLTVLFIYFWQKHRVHIRYIEHIYTRDELQQRIFKRNQGKIRNRLYIASAMTTLLPLTIVLLYLVLSLTPVNEMGELTPQETKIVLGRLATVTFPGEDLTESFKEDGFDGLYYISAIDNTMMFMGIFSGIIVSFIYILFFVNWSTAGIVRPVNELVRNMRQTGEGRLDNYTIVRTNDEIGTMSEGYNLMTSRLREYIFKISKINEAYSRFVPRQFLDFLDKNDIVDIRLGDQVQKEMTVMFSDIRGFTELSESMSPKENFDFINHYLGYMEPVISENNGFIDKFIGDSIMALFHDKVDDAIDAAIQMRATLQRFNEDRTDQGMPTIDSGIGIHTGNLMLGVVGGEGRMDGTVISDAVNLASRLEGLTKIYRTSIIISEDTLIKLENPSRYNFRFLDIARVKGKKEAVYVFELLDGEPENIKKLKIETKTLFGNGIDLYKNKKFEEALNVFTNVIKINKYDSVAAFYVNRCRTNITKGIPDDWNGIEVFDAK
ncbi:MAG: adenylate/guanylate cyclase domain-containing protein [Lentimicrobium sp.]|jgi:class 3 adenylate cyclase|nr:adenylate/guanylate cyclase domain-containing protein [Lentimicrobium sp.]